MTWAGCDECWRRADAWSAYRPVLSIRLCSPGTTYEHVRWTAESREENRRTLIKDQQSLIERVCVSGRSYHADCQRSVAQMGGIPVDNLRKLSEAVD